MGAMLMKIVILLKENWSHLDNFQKLKIWGGDATKNDNFQRGKVRVQGHKIFNMSSCHHVSYNLCEIFGGRPCRKSQFYLGKSGRAWLFFFFVVSEDSPDWTIFRNDAYG